MANLNKTYSRLDRLFILLENGTTETTRKAAAKQLGGVQKNHPYDLNNLLARLMTYVQHKDWDTRIAAAEAIKSVITEVPQWLPEPEVKKENRSADTTRDSKRLKFSQIDINQIMNGAQLLLSSSGVEFDSSLDEGIDARERVVRARQRLEKKLGLTVGGGANLGVTSADLFQDEDLIGHSEPGNQSSTSQSKPHSKKPKAKQPCIDIVTQLTEGMSNRERNRAKRKAKLLLKQNSRDATQENESQPPSKKKKTESTDSSPEENIFFSRAPKHEPLPELWVEWPFEWICEELLNLLFSPIWEWRHGACLALRDILKVHGSGAGILRGDTESEMTENNSAWLEDAAIRMLCVMVLDRFADFVSDQVVAPVRESCAQALGVLTKSLSTKTINDILNVLFYLTQVPEWEVRHAGFLGIKYILAVRVDLHEVIVDQCIPSLVRGLRDTDGDVKSVSAEALLPITLHLSRKETSSSHLRSLMEVLCGSLRDLDELTASTQSILTLLSKLVATISLQNISLLMNIKGTMSNLWVFLQHSIAAVRHSALLTLDALLNCMNVEGKIPWFESLASDGLLGLFQCCVLEPQPHIQKLAVQVWIRFAEKIPQMVLCNLCQQYFATWLLLAAQPENVPFAPTIFGVAAGQMTPSEDGTEHGGSFKYIAGNPNKRKDGNSETRSESVSRTRHHVSRMLGVLCGHSCLPSEDPFVIQTVHAVGHHLTIAITSRFALHRIVGCLILSSWWKSQTCTPPPHLHTAILHTLTEELYFNEITSLFVQVQSEIKQILLLAAKTLANPLSFALKQVYSLEEALNLVCELQQRLSEFESTELKDAYQRLHHIANEAQNEHQTLQRIVRSYTAHCLVISCCESSSTKSSVSIAQITKMNPIIRPLMEGLKNEENKVIRETISQSLTHLLDLCCDRDPCPNPKLIRNICQSLRGDNSTFPSLLDPALDIPDDILENANITSKENAIHYALLSLVRKNAMAAAQNSEGKRKRTLQELGVSPQRANSVNKNNPNLARGGALSCLDCACVHFDEKIFSALPQLWSIIAEPQRSPAQSNGVCSKKEAVDVELLNDKMISLLVVEAVAKSVNNTVAESKILVLLPDMLQLIWSPYSAVRFVCSRCLASLAIRFSAKFMTLFIEKFLPSIDASDDLYKRMGTVEMVANIIKCLGIDVLPYTVLLIVPLLGRMGDQNVQIRLIATQCFASLIQYLPVESSIPNPPNMPESLVSKKKSERRFLEQLLDSSSLDEYHIPVPINAKLRTYQQDGVKWMAFLNRYKLHGVLCDDMGLGKTLQSICILASDHYYRQEEYAKTKASNCVPLPSLVVCPPTLTGHWIDEIGKFCTSKYLNPLHYAGHPMERAKLQAQLKHHNLVVASYEVVRNDITFFRDVVWNYCILDEGHMIRNGKSKLTICVKTIKSNHRLILTGTPIQNSVLELWSLFDFLIPGFLGSENEFSTRYSKPIIASRDAKSTSKEQEEGVMAMEALHKQVLPFMLRRMKEDVLQDLPPKIIQDYYCNLSPLQVRLYEDFAKTRAKKDVDTSIAQADMDKNQTSRSKHTSHVFQALQYLQKVSNHPALVLTPCHPEYKQVMDHLDKEKTSLHDIQHSSKLVALKQLLLDCGIGAEDNNMDSIVNQHRALIFCQHKSMLDILEDDLLRTHMPTVTYLRLDGSVAANSRHGIVSKFNNDPSIDLLLLTTKVGGLGLNLTGADTVIFIEHDWNPTTDLQAMDRAHRIGQKRVVNVYRLITRGTLEEKILGLQQFKLNIANTVVSTENSSLHSMGTNQLLELFTIDKSSKLQKKLKETSGKGIRTLLEEVGELWDQSQYDTEYNLDNFMESLVI